VTSASLQLWVTDMNVRNVEEVVVHGFNLTIDHNIGHLVVYHDGNITWDQLQAVKDFLWGPETAAIEVYPPASKVVHSVNARHLWRLGSGEFYPDMLGEDRGADTLQSRYVRTWTADTEDNT